MDGKLPELELGMKAVFKYKINKNSLHVLPQDVPIPGGQWHVHR